jgi:hypothetical protein
MFEVSDTQVKRFGVLHTGGQIWMGFLPAKSLICMDFFVPEVSFGRVWMRCLMFGVLNTEIRGFTYRRSDLEGFLRAGSQIWRGFCVPEARFGRVFACRRSDLEGFLRAGSQIWRVRMPKTRFGVLHTEIRGFTYRDSGFYIPSLQNGSLFMLLNQSVKDFPKLRNTLFNTYLTHAPRMTACG